MFELHKQYPKCLQWGLPDFLVDESFSQKKLGEALQRNDSSPSSIYMALLCAYQLGNLEDSERRSQVKNLAGYVKACKEQLDLKVNPWGSLVVGVEIPAVLSQVASNDEVVKELLEEAASLLMRSSEKLFDSQGIIKAKHYGVLGSVMAVWARCFWGVRTKHLNLKLKKSFVNTFEWGVRQLLGLTDGQRRLPALSESTPVRISKTFVGMLLYLGGDLSDRRLAAHVGFPQKEFKQRVADHYLPDATLHSEPAQLSVMRSGWGKKRRELTFRYDRKELWLDLRSAGSPICSSLFAVHVVVDGQRLAVSGNWQEVCWESDDDADYLELEIALADGWKLQRHFLLAKEDDLLLVGDVLLGTGAKADLEIHQELRLAKEIQFYADDNHNEGFLWSTNPEAVVFPLALPEWRAGTRIGELVAQDNVLRYTVCKREQRAMYCPLLFSLNGKAGIKKYTWRRLTIAEQLERQDDDVAAGYRIQIGRRQWLLYRSLTEFGNRTLLGQNYSSEFAFGQFHDDGTVYEYVEIE